MEKFNQKIYNFHSVNCTLYKIKSNIIFQNLEIEKKLNYYSYGLKVNVLEDIKHEDIIDIKKMMNFK